MLGIKAVVLSYLVHSAQFVHGIATHSKPSHAAPVATVRNGTLRGSYSAQYDQDFFLGIPYAQPPLGDLRFNLPHSLNSSWHGFKDAVEYSPECIGYGGDDVGYPSSEDCLTLNVVRPAGVKPNSELPVAVWIHGHVIPSCSSQFNVDLTRNSGGFVMGGSADRRYNVSFMVQNSVEMHQPMIAVSINYRLAGWGFLYSSTIAYAGLSNIGLLDQRLALRWIQENIASFGGSPKKVTIWGESAGAMSVGAHLVAYGGRDDGLFRAAIAESGGPNLFTTQNAVTAQEGYDNVTQATGCATASDQIACLRAVPVDTLNDVLNSTSGYFMPVIDGTFLQTLASKQLTSGEFVKVPLLIGANSDEGTAFGQRGINTDAEFEALVMSKGADAETAKIMSYLYPNIPSIGIPATLVNPPTSTQLGLQYKRQAAFAGDYLMIGTRRASCEAWSNYSVPAYCYRFNVLVAGLTAETGSTHFQEVAFVFDNIHGYGYVPNAVPPFTNEPPTYTRLAKIMSRMWVSFVVNLEPNKHKIGGVPTWPVYDIHDGRGAQDMVFDTNVTTLAYAERDNFRAEGIAFINEVAASQFGR
ncbi:triacylglycerol lipase [Xylogone sp. PMI_703]|nr:triacylglycerol lipase [Xylogone sp. PMI_703]